MISLKEWMELVDYRITEGSDYGWQCYGHDAHMLDSWNGDQDGHSFTVVFDTKTQTVYEVQAHDYVHNRAYRLINPDFVKKHRKESKRRGVEKDMAWDDVNYTDLETDEDWIEKGLAIRDGVDYDTRVAVPVDFNDDELLIYMKMAHDRDITFNQFIEQALSEILKEYERNPEAVKAQAEQWKTDHEH
jgi:hypothetical protein